MDEPPARLEQQLRRQRTDVELGADERGSQNECDEQHRDAGAVERVVEVLADVHARVGVDDIRAVPLDVVHAGR